MGGMAQDPIDHAQQVAEVTAVLYEAFDLFGLSCTLVGGSAIEVHAPGIYKSSDIDVVIEILTGARFAQVVSQVFDGLGFEPMGRHWVIGDLFVEVPSNELFDPVQTVAVGHRYFQVLTKEALLAYRIIGFKHWPHATSYGQQAIDMIAAFGEELDMAYLQPRLENEDSYDAFVALKELAESDDPVTDEILTELLAKLTGS